MKPTMPLNGLIMTKNMQLLDVMTLVMDSMGVVLTVCLDKEVTLDALQIQQFDCAIIDWDQSEGCEDVIKAFRESGKNEKSFLITVVDDSAGFSQSFRSSANMVMYRPNNYKQALQSIKPAHASMLRQRRDTYRHPVKWKATVSDENGISHNATVTDISSSGLALKTSVPFQKSDSIKVVFSVPGEGYRSVSATSRVLWSTPGNAAGVKFSFIPEQQKTLLENWLAEEFKGVLNSTVKNSNFQQQFVAA